MLSRLSALAGYAPAHMTLGYRFYHGEGVPESCETALLHYEYAANEAASQIEKRGYVLPLERNRLSDDTAAAVRSSGAGGTEMTFEVPCLVLARSFLSLSLPLSFTDSGVFRAARPGRRHELRHVPRLHLRLGLQ
jgi:hypothetical protein